jgi:hypothetical protein
MDDQLTLRLPRDLARALSRRARELGVPKSQLVREALAHYVATPGPTPDNAWERVAPMVGSLTIDPAAVEADEIARRIRRHNWRT